MALAILIIIVWLVLGIYGAILENKTNNYFWFFLFISVIPFFPWIFKFCGVI